MVSYEVIERMMKYGGEEAKRVARLWLQEDEEGRRVIERRYKRLFEDYSGEPHSI